MLRSDYEAILATMSGHNGDTILFTYDVDAHTKSPPPRQAQ